MPGRPLRETGCVCCPNTFGSERCHHFHPRAAELPLQERETRVAHAVDGPHARPSPARTVALWRRRSTAPLGAGVRRALGVCALQLLPPPDPSPHHCLVAGDELRPLIEKQPVCNPAATSFRQRPIPGKIICCHIHFAQHRQPEASTSARHILSPETRSRLTRVFSVLGRALLQGRSPPPSPGPRPTPSPPSWPTSPAAHRCPWPARRCATDPQRGLPPLPRVLAALVR